MQNLTIRLCWFILSFLIGILNLTAQNEFTTLWKTDNPGISADNQIYIKTTGTGYDFTIDWGDGIIEQNLTGDVFHTYASAGVYTIKISGDFPRITFSDQSDNGKIIDVIRMGGYSMGLYAVCL